MNIKMMILILTIVVAAVAVANSAWQTGAKTTFVDARVERSVQMCIPFYSKYNWWGRGSRRVIPDDWPSSGKPCLDIAAIKNAKRMGYRKMASHWIVDVSLPMEDGTTLQGEITTLGKPVVVFKPGTARDPDITRGMKYDPLPLNGPEEPDPKQIKPGDLIPVSFVSDTGRNLAYAPNTLVYTQHTWVWVGFAALLLFTLLLFRPDGAPETEEGRRYVQYMRDKHWSSYGE